MNTAHHEQQAASGRPSSAATVWLTGLPGSGKSTLAGLLQNEVRGNGGICCLLDGDSVRTGLSADLGFSAADRHENVRRVAEVARIVNGLGVLVVVALISPTRRDRDTARSIIGADRFVEVFVDAPLQVCKERDPKGMYRKAALGQLRDFTGVSAPYEIPETASLVVRTHETLPEQAMRQILSYLDGRR